MESTVQHVQKKNDDNSLSVEVGVRTIAHVLGAGAQLKWDTPLGLRLGSTEEDNQADLGSS
jgi:hypothetical protein